MKIFLKTQHSQNQEQKLPITKIEHRSILVFCSS